MNTIYTAKHIQKGPFYTKCGQRVAIPHRDSFDKENHARYRAISKGEPVVCVYCGARIETK